jgi:predicted ribosome quality control (RQC) complex YloA/Tae2 family protein
VIVPLDGGRVIDQDTLDQAALLAAWFSSARAELQVDVGYCFRKELRRAARGRPGAVFAPQQKTVRVRQDAERLAALLASEQD